jgi:hypothetical protein
MIRGALTQGIASLCYRVAWLRHQAVLQRRYLRLEETL